MATTEKIWQKALLQSTATIEEVIKNLNNSGIKISIVVNKTGVLQGIISDGDIRRGLLSGLNLQSPIDSILMRNPMVVKPDLERDIVLQLMQTNKIQQIPIVDSKYQVVGVHLWDEINFLPERLNLMVIMCGGFGMRLLPHTKDCPKPMLLIAGKPMLEHIISRAKKEGFKHFVLATHYLGHVIEDYFGNGNDFGVHINYIKEQSPLGTAGALGLLNPIPSLPIVVTNGDVITDFNYGQILDYHKYYESTATMAVREHELQHPFGVVHTKGLEIIDFEEKPIIKTKINAGIYVIEPNAIKLLQTNTKCDMPTLFNNIKAEGNRIIIYPMYESWLDVGNPNDLNAAQSASILKS